MRIILLVRHLLGLLSLKTLINTPYRLLYTAASTTTDQWIDIGNSSDATTNQTSSNFAVGCLTNERRPMRYAVSDS